MTTEGTKYVHRCMNMSMRSFEYTHVLYDFFCPKEAFGLVKQVTDYLTADKRVKMSQFWAGEPTTTGGQVDQL